mmetsp:Transcript_33644/g.74492  ORF Transcript_33644/g.74492 Transcript_33644/m.74492 type:complete len:944 (+) Transcript_33644:69-2900(+)|eukprot:CAMPEP_0202894016 /NCGR_PEP_ID=MMETSP1392-20130828/3480_1 /ASSEMBLY_ACC=CAM_ASM_000868 /TAXON_ID=225041 /ORGANISM="Chlamydomonas chlamydogama, Strain SAG 11-48b" /LENGTH=943 /DNA_ID=CAMNT_0049578549 /DNA_START=42 /DNA_END=2873 /DNA_ORIENTATION=-
MDGATQSRLNLLKAFTATVDSGEAGLTDSKCNDISSAFDRQQLLLEPLSSATSDSAASASTSGGPLTAAVSQWTAAVLKRLNRDHAGARIAGARLLAATCRSCTTSRLLHSYQAWGSALLDLVKRHAAAGGSSSDVRAACFTALAELFNRLLEVVDVPGVRREASPIASKTAGTALGLLAPQLQPAGTQQAPANEGGTDKAPSSAEPAAAAAALASPALQLAALEAVAAALAALPTSLKGHAPNLEKALADLVAGQAAGGAARPAVPGEVRRAAARCLALLPRCLGDSETWSQQARRALLSAHECLDVVFMGLDDADLAARCREPLQLSSSEPSPGLLPPVPGVTATAAAAATNGVTAKSAPPLKSLRPALDTLAALLGLLERMLVAPYPAPVPVPAGPLLGLCTRMLRMDEGAVVAAGRVPSSSTMFAELCTAMPAVRCTAWGMLSLLHEVARTALAPLVLPAGRLIAEGLRRARARGTAALAAAGPAERSAMYRSAVRAVQVAGLPLARQLAPEALGAAMVELYGSGAVAAALEVPGLQQQQQQGAAAAAPSQHSGRPAKKAKTSGSDVAVAAAAAAAATGGAVPAGGTPADLAAQGHALQLLAAVVQVAGGCLTPELRARYDSLAVHVACCCSDAAAQVSREPGAGAVAAAAVRALQLQSYRLLQVTLLAPCSHRAPYLSQALSLFRRGCSESSAELSSWCTAAVLSCEALLHPRSLPIQAVQQFAGMQDMPALAKPRMWSAVQPEVQAAGLPASVPPAHADGLPYSGGAAAPHAPQTQTQQPQQQQQAPQLQQQGQLLQPQLQQGGHSLASSHQPPTAAANKAAAVHQPQQQHQQYGAGASGPVQPHGSMAAAHAPPQFPTVGSSSAGTQGAVARPPAVVPALVPSRPVAAAPATSTPVTEVKAGATVGAYAAGADESEDSEGPLPDIDSGVSDEEMEG